MWEHKYIYTEDNPAGNIILWNGCKELGPLTSYVAHVSLGGVGINAVG